MSTRRIELICPCCGAKLKAFTMPDGAGWDQEIQWACFNNDCPYYKSGWEWMWEKYSAKASYRYRVVDPDKPRGTPLVVQSEHALINLIVEGQE